MARLPEEDLMAYVDGALDAEAARRVEAILAADPAERDRLRPYQITRQELARCIDAALAGPIPDRLIDTVLSAPLGPPRSAGVMAGWTAALRDLLFPAVPTFASGLALAASVAAIAGAGWTAASVLRAPVGGAQSGQELVAVVDDALFASGALQAALDTTASGASFEAGLVKVTPALTFRDKDGRICRQYTVAPAGRDALAGYACRTSAKRWSVAFHAAAPKGAAADGTGTYRPAGDAYFPALEAAIDKSIAGNTLSPAEEKALLSGGWGGAEK